MSAQIYEVCTLLSCIRIISDHDSFTFIFLFRYPNANNAEKMLDEIYRVQNRNRTRPCIQSRSDAYRILKYDINTASQGSDHTHPLLLIRHNIVPGMFLVNNTIFPKPNIWCQWTVFQLNTNNTGLSQYFVIWFVLKHYTINIHWFCVFSKIRKIVWNN